MRTYFLRYTKNVEQDFQFPHSREFITVAQILPEDDWDTWNPAIGDNVDVWDTIYGESSPTTRTIVAYDASDGVVALEQPGLCGITIDHVPATYALARASAYYLGRDGYPWAPFLALYEGSPVGKGFDSVLFRPQSLIKLWNTHTQIEVTVPDHIS
jgi:hypothetical protein